MKPFVSYLLFAYNHERFIAEALQSALAQDYEPMEIIVTDDGSADGTAEIIEQAIAAYTGGKTIRFKRNEANLGVATALNNAVADAKGEILIGAAGDDISLPYRTARIVEAFDREQGVRCVYSNAERIDTSGSVSGLWFKGPRNEPSLKKVSNIHGATAAYHRQIFDVFGPVDAGLKAEDQVLALRSLILGRVIYLDEALVQYRKHDTNVWFGTYDQVSSVKDRWKHARTRNWMWLTIAKNRQRDLDTALGKFPELRADLKMIRKANARALKQAELECGMYDNKTLIAGLATTIKMLLSTPDRQYIKRWVGLFMVPGRRYKVPSRG